MAGITHSRRGLSVLALVAIVVVFAGAGYAFVATTTANAHGTSTAQQAASDATLQQSASVTITDTLTTETSQFDVAVSGLDGTAQNSGCLVVENSNTGSEFERTDIGDGGTFTVTADDMGGLSAGDVITATVYDFPFDCVEQLDSDSATVQGTATFDVSIESTNSPVTEGQTVEVDATIENTGDSSGTQQVSLAIDGTTVDTQELFLDRAERRTVTFQWQTGSGDAGGYVATVESEDDTASRDVVVEEGGSFAVNIDSTNSPVPEGDTLTVTGTVENTGEATATKTIDLRIDGSTVSSTSVTLDGGAATQVTLEWNTETGDVGTHEATLASEDDTDTRNVVVEEPATFDVAINSTNSPVAEGETLTVTATIENTGDTAGSQNIRLRIDGTTVAVQSVALDTGESTTIELEWATENGDAGEYDAVVMSDDDQNSVGVSVDSATFDVAIESTNAPVAEGETLNITAEIENTGAVRDTQGIGLEIDGRRVVVQSLTLDGGDTFDVTLQWTPEEGDAGEYDATVTTDNNQASTDVTILENATFEVTIDSTNAPVTEGEPLTVTATIENTGEVSGTQDIGLTIDGETVTTQTISLDGGESTTIELTWETGDPREYDAAVTSDDGEDSTAIRTLERSAFEVTIESTTSPVVEGEPLTVTATIENTGESAGTQDIGFTIDGETITTQTVSLDGGESTTIELTWETEDAGEYDAAVTSDDDEDSTDVRVLETATFGGTVDSTNSPVVEGETLTVTATIENTGDEQGTKVIDLTIDGETVDSVNRTIGAGGSTTVELTWETERGDVGEYEATVASEDDQTTMAVRVLKNATFEVGIDSTNAPVTVGDQLNLTATIENIGAVSGTQDIALEIDNTTVTTQTVTLESGESTTAEFSWETGERGEYTARVASDNDATTTAITVTEDPGTTFVVTIEEVSTPPDGTGEFGLRATIENTRGRDDTQTVTVSSGGTVRGSQNVTLASGESTTVTFTWEQEGDEVNVEVASETDRDESTATVGGSDRPVSPTQAFGLFLLLLLLLALYYYVRRRQLDDDAEDYQDQQETRAAQQGSPEGGPRDGQTDGPSQPPDQPPQSPDSNQPPQPPDTDTNQGGQSDSE